MTLHFHVTPVGGSITMAAQFLKGRYALVSFSDSSEMDVVKRVGRGYIIDNGAYRAWKTGGSVDCDRYVDFVRTHLTEKLMWSFIPDIIDGSAKQNDSLISTWPSDLVGVPVYHMHEDFSRLRNLASSFDIVAIGSSGKYANPGTYAWWSRLAQCLAHVVDCAGVPITKLHGLRMLAPKLIKRIPFYSADSSMVGRNSHAAGKRMFQGSRGAAAEIIAARIERYKSPPCWKSPLASFEGLL